MCVCVRMCLYRHGSNAVSPEQPACLAARQCAKQQLCIRSRCLEKDTTLPIFHMFGGASAFHTTASALSMPSTTQCSCQIDLHVHKFASGCAGEHKQDLLRMMQAQDICSGSQVKLFIMHPSLKRVSWRTAYNHRSHVSTVLACTLLHQYGNPSEHGQPAITVCRPSDNNPRSTFCSAGNLPAGLWIFHGACTDKARSLDIILDHADCITFLPALDPTHGLLILHCSLLLHSLAQLFCTLLRSALCSAS